MLEKTHLFLEAEVSRIEMQDQGRRFLPVSSQDLSSETSGVIGGHPGRNPVDKMGTVVCQKRPSKFPSFAFRFLISLLFQHLT